MARATKVSQRVTNVAGLAAATFLGLAIALSISTLFLVAHQINASPLPMPLAIAFVVRLFGKGAFSPHVLLPLGLAFHMLYLTTATVTSVRTFHRRLGAASAFITAFVLWLGAGAVFLPVVGWGAFGLGLGVGAAVFVAGVHALYGLFLWAGAWAVFRVGPEGGVAVPRAVLR